MILELLYITLIVVFIVDLSGAIDTLKGALARWLKCRAVRIPPFDCSLCMTWWACIIYTIATGNTTLGNILLCAMFALSADKIAELLTLVRDMISAAINAIYKLLKL